MTDNGADFWLLSVVAAKINCVLHKLGGQLGVRETSVKMYKLIFNCWDFVAMPVTKFVI